MSGRDLIEDFPAYWFGMTPPMREREGVVAAWGARAILASESARWGQPARQRVDLLPDRQQAVPDTVPAEFVDWLNTGLRAWLDSGCGEGWIDPGGVGVLRLEDGRFRAHACPSGSHGYLYVGAWMTAD